jgi:xanthine dehydrogenase YagT iron-sulfur-binding subunit
MDVEIVLRVNGAEHHLGIDPRTTLLDALRERMGSAVRAPF